MAGVLPVVRLSSPRSAPLRPLDQKSHDETDRTRGNERERASYTRARMRTQLNETGIASGASSSSSWSSSSSSSASSSASSFAFPILADSRVSENLIYMHTHAVSLIPNRTCSAILSMIWMLTGRAMTRPPFKLDGNSAVLALHRALDVK